MQPRKKSKKNTIVTIKKGIKSKTTTTKKKEEKNLQKYGEGKLDHSHFPLDWLNVHSLPQPPVLSMHQCYNKALPRVLIHVHGAKGLTKHNAYAKITIGSLQSEPFVTKEGKKTTDPEWNEEFLRSAIEEDGPNPFLCTVTVFGAKTMGTDTPIGTFQVDLFYDLGMRINGDQRRFDFPLNTQGTVSITFVAQTELMFPEMNFLNIDGLPSTICLPYNPHPIVELTVHQALFLHEEKRIQSHFLIQLLTFDFNALPGARPEKIRTLLKSAVVKGNSPFWAEKTKTPLYSTKDSIRIILSYVCGKKGSKEEQIVKTFSIEEIQELATATETRRWYPLPNKFKNGKIGIEFRALSNMLAVEGLPDPPGVLSVEEWNERQKNGGRHALPSNIKIETVNAVPYDILGQRPIRNEEESKVGQHISDLLGLFNDIHIMDDDETQNTMFIDSYEPGVRSEQVKEWKEVESLFNQQMSRLEVDMGKVDLQLKKKKQDKDAQELQLQINKFNDERSRLLDGAISSLGNNVFRSDINSLPKDINEEVDNSSNQRMSLNIAKPPLVHAAASTGSIPPLTHHTGTGTGSAVVIVIGGGGGGRSGGRGGGSSGHLSATLHNQYHNIQIHTRPTSFGGFSENDATEVPISGGKQSVPLTSSKVPQTSKRNVLSIHPRVPPVSASNDDNQPQNSLSAIHSVSRSTTQTFVGANSARSYSSTTNLGTVVCTICKVGHEKEFIAYLRGKPFCFRCKDKLLEGAKQRGMKI